MPPSPVTPHRGLLAASAAGVLLAIAAATVASPPALGGQPRAAAVRAAVADRVQTLTRESSWERVSAVRVKFRTHHPQGLVRIGDTLFVSSVEVTRPTRRYPAPVNGLDRDAGAGVGHLFKLALDGTLIADLEVGEGDMYHPGGIDYDGTSIWMPVAEYRPDSRSIVYRVDPSSMKATEVFRVPDHIGALACDPDENRLHGVSWGSRRFYRWTPAARGGEMDAGNAPRPLRMVNPSHYVDYQDCKYAGKQRMLCSGVTEIRQAQSGPPFALGGLELIDLAGGRPLHQVPVLLWTSGGVSMTRNATWLEPHGPGLRAYFMPEDDRSTIYVYDVAPK